MYEMPTIPIGNAVANRGRPQRSDADPDTDPDPHTSTHTTDDTAEQRSSHRVQSFLHVDDGLPITGTDHDLQRTLLRCLPQEPGVDTGLDGDLFEFGEREAVTLGKDVRILLLKFGGPLDDEAHFLLSEAASPVVRICHAHNIPTGYSSLEPSHELTVDAVLEPHHPLALE